MGIFDGLFGGGEQKSTTEIKLSPEQQAIVGQAMPYIKDFASQGVQLPGQTGIVGFNPTQTQAQGMALGAAGTQGQLAGAGAGFAGDLFSGKYLDPRTNPALQGTIDAATRPIFEGLTEQILPGIRGEAVTTGNMGSSRQGIAEGMAAREASRAAGDVGSQIAYQGYNSGLQAMLQNLGMLPNTLKSQTAAAGTTGAVGDVQQQLAQMMLSEQQDRFMQEQLMPLMIGKELAGIASGLPGGGTTSVTKTPGTSPLAAGLGIGSTLLGLL